MLLLVLLNVCAQCRPILVRYADTFKTMVHQGNALKKRKRTNPNPKRSGSIPYRDVKQQNEWLQSNVFDSMGNYLYCCACICAAFSISKQRLARQRKIKRQQSQHPIVEMSKAQVEEKSLGKYVIMPDSEESSFKTWWQSLPELAVISVRYPYTRHGNTGKPSNSAKATVLNDFLAFVDANSQPNGRSGDSSGPTHYFVSKFATVQAPKPGCHHYEERLKRSVVGEFNRAQREAGRDTCSNGSSHNWLKKYRPKLSICPHQEDYCDTCSKLKEGIRAKQTTINRLLASASADPSEISLLENDKMSLNQALEDHRHKAVEAHKYYVDTTKLCAEEWAEIADLVEGRSLSPEENEHRNVRSVLYFQQVIK